MPATQPSPAELSLAGRIAANTRWAKEPDRYAATAPAREGMAAKFEREADPDGVLPPAERARRAESLRKAYFARLGLRSAQSRRRARTEAAEAAEAAELDAAERAE